MLEGYSWIVADTVVYSLWYVVYILREILYDVLLYDWFAEMVEFMKNVAKIGMELSVEERNLLSVAYKNVIGAQRSAWRIISSIEQKEENKGESSKLELTKQYRLAVSFCELVVA